MPLRYLADWIGAPIWFVGGMVGMVVFIVLLIFMGRGKIRSPASIFVILGLSAIFIPLFLYPIWVPMIVGAVLVITFMQRREPRRERPE